ncbi:tonsoku-like protein [Mantella aurantiaca]
MRSRLFLNLGFLYDIMGETEKCSYYIRKSIFISEQIQLHDGLYRANVLLAGIHLRNAEHSKAVRCWEAGGASARRMRDKFMESECYCSIGRVLLSLGDLSAGKRSLKKAFRLGSQQQSDRETVCRYLKYAIKGCHLEEMLSEVVMGDQRGALPLYEQLGDLYCKVDCYSKAVEYYKLQLSCAQALCRPDREISVIHVSLAATYSDLKDYKNTILHYQEELELRKGNPVEECKTWQNMAMSVEEDSQGLEGVQRCLLSALRCAREAEALQLQRKVLRQLLEAQRKWASPEAAGTEAQLAELCGDSGSEEEEEEEEENSETLPESDIELSQSDDDEDLEGYEKSVPGKRRSVQWNRRNEKGETILHRSCIEGNLKLTNTLLDKGHPLNPRDYCGWTPLHEACNHGHLEIVQLLIDRGANINDAGGPMCEGTTPLHDALTCGNFQVAQLLINRGASVTQRNAKGVTALVSLQEWFKMYGKHLDQETREACKHTERLLHAALAGKVAQTSQPKEDLQDSEVFDAQGSPPRSVHPSRDLPLAERTHGRTSSRDLPLAERTHGRTSSRDLPLAERTHGRTSSRDLPLAERTHGRTSSRDLPLAERTHGRTSSRDLPLAERTHGRTSSRDLPLAERTHGRTSSSSSRDLHWSSLEVTIEGSPSLTSTQISSQDPRHDEDSENLLTPLNPVKKKARFAPHKSSSVDVAPARNDAPSTPHQRVPEGGKEAYQQAIHNLGSAKSRLLNQSLTQPDLPAEEGSTKAALVPAEEYLGDDWLEDDLRSQWRSRKRMRRSPTPIEIEEVEETSEEEPRPEEPWRDKPRPSSLSRKRSRQTKLTHMVDRAIVGRTKNDTPTPRETDAFRATCAPEESGASLLSTVHQMTPPPPMRVRVRVQDNVFLIPIPHSDSDTREISWLADQASQRYYQSCGLRPRLTLKKEGALLDPQDLILYVLQSNEEVLAEVQSWDLPPLSDRYKKSCQSLGVKEVAVVMKALERQEAGSVLSLGRLALRAQGVCPVLRALKLHSSLRQLDLSGNLLGDGEMEELSAMLVTLPHLTHLNLSGNRITHHGISKLAPQDGRLFQKLEDLDVGLNPLGDGLARPLTSLLLLCPLLTSINLQACHLTASFLQQLGGAFRGAAHIRSVSLSHNPLGSLGLELILKMLPHDRISRLDLQAVTTGGALMVESMVRYLSQDGCVLSHLILSSNNLNDESVKDLARCLLSSSLKTVDISGNPNVGVKGFESLLFAIQERNQEMDQLILTGCSLQGPLNTSLLDGVSSLIQELRLGSQNLSKKDRNLVTQSMGAESQVLSRHNKLFFRRTK